MRFIVYGAGAIGGAIGGRLRQHGFEVVLIARGPHYEAIRAGGLRLETPEAAVTIDIEVADHPAAIRMSDDDVVILATKSQDTAGALDALASSAPGEVAVVCAQNGVENERAALRRFRNVYGVCVMCPAAHLEPGRIEAFSSPITGLLDIGRYPEGVDDRAADVAAAFSSSTFDSIARPDILRWKYAKLLANLANAIEAACGPGGRKTPLLDLVRREGVACLEAAGIEFASEAEDAARRGDLLQLHPIGGRRRPGGSSYQSLERRIGSIETDFLNGEIVLLGRVHGIPTPANELLQDLAKSMAGRHAPPGSVTAEDVLARLAMPRA